MTITTQQKIDEVVHKSIRRNKIIIRFGSIVAQCSYYIHSLHYTSINYHVANYSSLILN